MKASITPDKRMLESVQDGTLAIFEQSMSITFAISLATTLEYCGFGSKRANELLDEIFKALDRYEDYDDDNYTIRELSKQLEKRGIDADCIFKKSLGLKASKQHEKKKNESKNKITYTDAKNVEKNVEKFRLLKKFLENEGD